MKGGEGGGQVWALVLSDRGHLQVIEKLSFAHSDRWTSGGSVVKSLPTSAGDEG